MEQGGQIYRAMVGILRDVDAIGKTEKNQAQGFMFRGIDTIMNELHSIFCKHGVFICPRVLDYQYLEKTNKSGGWMLQLFARVEFVFTAEDGSSVSMIGMGEAADSGDKSTSKAMSIALKYALLQAFLIPTAEEKDPDGQTHTLSGRVKKSQPRYTPEQEQVIAQKTGAAPQEPPKMASAGGSPIFDALKHFAEMKKKIGEKEYYYILGSNGYEKSNQITDLKDARRIYLQMGERSKELELMKENR